MSDNVVIIGAGGHGKVAADIVLSAGDRVLGFLDDREGASIGEFPWLGRIKDFRRILNARFLAAVGDASTREKITTQLEGVRWYTAVHPQAVISHLDTKIGEGTVVMAGAVINPGAKIGRHCIINTGAIVEHDNQIGDFAHISVGAHLAGAVCVGSGTWVGVGASVRNNLTICEHVVIGVGSVVVKDIEEPGTYMGVPVRRTR